MKRATRFVTGAAALMVTATMTFAQNAWETIPDPAPLPEPAVSGMVATADHEKVYFEVHGTTGDWLVFLHGGTGSALSWGNQVPAFAGDHRVLMIESQGHGRSTWNGEPLHYERMADDVVAVMDALGIAKAPIVGWSDGGNIAMIMGYRYPDKVARFVTFGSNADTDAYDMENLSKPPYTIESNQSEMAYRSLSPTPEKWESFSAAVYKMWTDEPHMLDELQNIQAPALIAVGQYDAISVKHSQDIVDRIPGAKLAVMPDASHFMPIQAPEAFNAMVLEFLASN